MPDEEAAPNSEPTWYPPKPGQPPSHQPVPATPAPPDPDGESE